MIKRSPTLGGVPGRRPPARPDDQIHNFLRAGAILQEKQLQAAAAARLCDHPDGPTAIGFGGARELRELREKFLGHASQF